MLNDDPAFARPIFTRRHLNPPLALEVATVGQAIDLLIDDLTEAEQSMQHWQVARDALLGTFDAPGDAGKLAAAEEAVRKALRAEGTHIESGSLGADEYSQCR